MSTEIRFRKKRLRKFLIWLKAQEGASKHELEEWFFQNYALSEKTRQRDIRDLVTFGFVYIKGLKFYVKGDSELLFKE